MGLALAKQLYTYRHTKETILLII